MPTLVSSSNLNIDSFSSLYESDSVRNISMDNNAAEIVELNRLLKEADSDGVKYSAHVYHLEVEDFHTYYVGKAGILVQDLQKRNDFQPA